MRTRCRSVLEVKKRRLVFMGKIWIGFKGKAYVDFEEKAYVGFCGNGVVQILMGGAPAITETRENNREL